MAGVESNASMKYAPLRTRSAPSVANALLHTCANTTNTKPTCSRTSIYCHNTNDVDTHNNLPHTQHAEEQKHKSNTERQRQRQRHVPAPDRTGTKEKPPTQQATTIE
jgi:hypothetical protein